MQAQREAADSVFVSAFSLRPATAKEKWSEAGKVAAGALMVACFIGEPCGAFEAGASLVVGATAVGEAVSH